jgi:peptide/nickel transport system permease protein
MLGGGFRLLRRHPLGLLGLVILLIVALAAVTAPLTAPYDPQDTGFTLLEGPSWAHPFGTDRVGRDVLSRVMYGAQMSLLVGVASVALGTVVGSAIGLLSGYLSGWSDTVIQRVIDVLMAFPYLVLALFIVAVFGKGTGILIVVIAIAIVPGVTRVVRGSVLSERERDYVIAARALGSSDLRVMFRHILPNVLSPIIVIGTTLLAGAVLAEAALSFLGLGIPPPTPSWGADLSGEARTYFELAPWMAIFPGVALSLTVLGFNFLGDAVRDILDPRMRGEVGI